VPEHVHLLFAVEGDIPPELVEEVAALVDELNGSRQWSCGEIVFVNEPDEASAGNGAEDAVWTLGGVLTLPRPADVARFERAAYEDVAALVDRLRRFTRTGVSLVVEYDGEAVGWIEDGEADESLRIGLLDEWRKALP
jgi:hypothetical protein